MLSKALGSWVSKEGLFGWVGEHFNYSSDYRRTQLGLVIVYWTIAFVVCSSIPQIQTIVGFVGAAAIMQFTFTFPPLLWLAYQVMTDAMIEDKAYSPGNGNKGRIDTWKDWSRWKRGLFSGRWYFKMFNLVLGFAGLTAACLGMWAAGSTIRATFAISGAATSFGCTAPVWYVHSTNLVMLGGGRKHQV